MRRACLLVAARTLRPLPARILAARRSFSVAMSAAPTKISAADAARAAAAQRPAVLRTLYPPIKANIESTIQVSDIHTCYWEESGNPEGKPIICVHGGPGAGSDAFYRQFFDPKAYRIIQLDQRGAGKSTPHACLEDNTTWDLVEDMEKLRKQLKIEKGSTLALAYAQKHPAQVKALVLRGIFLLRREELQYFYQEGTSFIFPDAFERYASVIPQPEQCNLISAFHRRLTGPDEDVKLKCATAWSVYEMATSRLKVDPAYIARAEDDGKFAIAFARIECHYFVNGGFFEVDGQLLRDAHLIKDIPGTIVQGRYDMVCPMKSAWDLHKVWPKAEFRVVPDAGHSCKEEGIISDLIEATDKYRDL